MSDAGCLADMHVLLPPPATAGHRDHQRLTTAAHTTLTGSVVLAGLLLGWAEQVDPVAQTLTGFAVLAADVTVATPVTTAAQQGAGPLVLRGDAAGSAAR